MYSFKKTRWKIIGKKMLIILSCMVFLVNIPCEAHIGSSDIAIGGIQYGTSTNYVKKLYGEPKLLSISYIDHFHEGKVERMTYANGLSVEAVNGSVVLVKLDGSSSRISTPAGISVNKNTDSLRFIYGTPDRGGLKFYIYTAIDDPKLQLRFLVNNDKIYEINLEYNERRYVSGNGGSMPSEQLVLGGISLNNSMQEVMNAYGSPKYYRKGLAYYGNGLEIQYFNDNYQSKIYEIRVTERNGFATPAGIEVGMTDDVIEKIYGRPDIQTISGVEKTYAYYGSGKDDYKYMKFLVKNNIITGIYLHWAD